MSKQNSEKIDFDLEASNAFTLKGDEEAQMEFSSKIEIENNKKHSRATNSHQSIKISNLTNYSFGHKLINDESDNDNDSEIDNNDIIGTFKKCDSVVKIKLTKMKKRAFLERKNDIKNLRVDIKDTNMKMNIKGTMNKISDKELDNLIEHSTNNKMDMDLINEKNSTKNEKDIVRVCGNNKNENDFNIKNVEHRENKEMNEEEINKDNSLNMIIEIENKNISNNENEKENTLIHLEKKDTSERKEDIEYNNIEEKNKEEKEEEKEEDNIDTSIKLNKEKISSLNINDDEQIKEEKKFGKKELKKLMKQENIKMSCEDINRKEDKKEEIIEKYYKNKESNEHKGEITLNWVEEKNESMEDNSDKTIKKKEKKKNDDNFLEDNINRTNVNCVNEEKEEKKMEEKIKEEKYVEKKEGNDIDKNELNKNKEQKNINENIDIYAQHFFDKLKQQIKIELCEELMKNENNNFQMMFNPQGKENNFLGKKRIISNSLNKSMDFNDNENMDNCDEIMNTNKIYQKENKENILESEKEKINEENKNNENNENNEIYNIIEKNILDFLYDKITSNSLSNNNDLEKKIIKIIDEKGYAKVKSSLINRKQEKKENEKTSIKWNNLSNEYHYHFMNNIYYRYKILNNKSTIQKYMCCIKECHGLAELNIKERKFSVIQKHSLSQRDHLLFNDDKPIYFMKSRKLEEVHIKKNNNNDKYHLEWFK